jgi:hypothetical protein
MSCQPSKKKQVRRGGIKMGTIMKIARNLAKSGTMKHCISGASSVMNVAGSVSFKARRRKSDSEAIMGDVRAVGGDMRPALRRAQEQPNLAA